jgi:hypothetical protein
MAKGPGGRAVDHHTSRWGWTWVAAGFETSSSQGAPFTGAQIGIAGEMQKNPHGSRRLEI